MHTRTHIHKLHITGHFTELVELCSTITIINPCYPIQTTPFYEKITRNLAYLRSRWGPCAQHGPQRCGFLFTGRTCCWLVSLSPGSKWIYLGILHSVAAAGNTDAWCFTRPCIHSVKSMLTHAPVTISIWLGCHSAKYSGDARWLTGWLPASLMNEAGWLLLQPVNTIVIGLFHLVAPDP